MPQKRKDFSALQTATLHRYSNNVWSSKTSYKSVAYYFVVSAFVENWFIYAFLIFKDNFEYS